MEGVEVVKYSVILEPLYPERGYLVRVPAFRGCITWGGSRDEAIARATEAITGYIEGLDLAGDTVPEEVAATEVHTVTV